MGVETDNEAPGNELTAMSPIWCNAAALAVAVLFYAWKAYGQARQRRRQKLLRERVAFLLWSAAVEVDSAPHPSAG